MSPSSSNIPASRGPADHAVRDQIVSAAEKHFSHYGYEKTTVSDLARDIGFSKAYVYKFFPSKEAIAEVICSRRLKLIADAVDKAANAARTPTEKFRAMFKAQVKACLALFFNDRKLYEIAAFSARERWGSTREYDDCIRKRITEVLVSGRSTGEFERKTPLDEAVEGIFLVLAPFTNPLLLQHNLDIAEESPALLASLVLRSLAP